MARQVVEKVASLVGPGGTHGFLKEASTCRIETSFDVSFNKPFSPYPNVMDFGEGCLASPFRSESVAVG